MIRATLFVFLPIVALAADVAGTWNIQLVRFGETFAAARVELKAEATAVTGTLNELKLNGTFEGK